VYFSSGLTFWKTRALASS